ncbi:MAG TPA: prepilin-type N-terminal cleavage/methylation domain-containing protein [Planctomycetota bacterium]|nr:prepilin-type N-terminal cleavage/methylation domain-containing protein [Planctomycetota bacterium]
MIRRGFTLIEALLAVALSMTVVLTAVAGVRLAAQSVTAANRNAVENGLIRAGYFMAVDEADFWRDYDDPFDATRQRLRGYDAARRRGLPFTPFDATVMPRSGTPGAEDERGWDPEYQWPASDARTWFHGNLVEHATRTQHRFGHHEIFAHVKEEPTLARTFVDGLGAATPAYAGYGQVRTPHTWAANQLTALKNALGYYGVTEYMPANTIYGVHGAPGADNAYGSGPGDPLAADDTDQGLAHEWCLPSGSGGGVQWRFANDDGDTAWPRGIYRLVRDSTFPVIPASATPAADTTPWTLQTLVAAHGRSWATDRVAASWQTGGIPDLLAKAQMAIAVVPLRPASWPAVSRATMRYLNNCRFTALNKIRWISPVTGARSELSFTLVATSLRGARQQRSPTPTGGWARPGQPTLDAP